MPPLTIDSHVGAAGQGVSLATVVEVRGELVLVTLTSDLGEVAELECDSLHTTHAPPVVAPGDQVLCVRVRDDRGVVLGRIGPGHLPSPKTADIADDTPDSLVLEARHSLVLRVGDGSITIRADGKILIKGKDLVSHAQRVNRIKGGSVAIN